MILHPPFSISPRLLPCVVIGGANVQLEYDGRTLDNRTRYKWTIDLQDGQSFSGNDLLSGCGGGSLQDGFASLLSFLGAFAESLQGGDPCSYGDNSDLFPAGLQAWATANADEFSLLELEIRQAGQPLIDEMGVPS